jgi:hypothetical protein
MYEAWGHNDIIATFWAGTDEFCKIESEVKTNFPADYVELFRGRFVHDFGCKASVGIADPVFALAIQENVHLDGLTHEDFLCSSCSIMPLGEGIRAFTFVCPAQQRQDDEFHRQAIRSTVREKMSSLWKKEVRKFKQFRIIDLENNTNSLKPVLVIEYVVAEYGDLPEVPGEILDIGSRAIATTTSLVTGRLIIQSDKVLL